MTNDKQKKFTFYCDCCNEKFESNNEYSAYVCHDCKRKKGSNFYKTIALLTIIGGIICGITFGNIYKVSTLKSESSVDSKYNTYEEKFNYPLMIGIWDGTITLGIFIYGIYSISHRLDLLIDLKQKDID